MGPEQHPSPASLAQPPIVGHSARSSPACEQDSAGGQSLPGAASQPRFENLPVKPLSSHLSFPLSPGPITREVKGGAAPWWLSTLRGARHSLSWWPLMVAQKGREELMKVQL